MGIAKEIYEADGVFGDSKEVFVIMDDGSLSYKTYIGEKVFEEENPVLVQCGKGQRIEYGCGIIRSSTPFRNYSDGEIDKRWTKIL